MERKKFQRVNRDRRLTEAEVKKDEEIRNHVMNEYPPMERIATEAGGMSDALRQAIQASPKSIYQICTEAGISQIVISRLVSGRARYPLGDGGSLGKSPRC